MKIIFLGDAHLKGEGEAAETELVEFLYTLKDLDYLVILGDLFDFWTETNTVARSRYGAVLRTLKEVKEHGVKIIYAEGNHDFAMGGFFTKELGARVVEGEAVLTLDNKRFYLSHGDTVGMTKGYRRWRGFLRSPFCSFLMRVMPSEVVWSIAMRLSGRSRSYNTKGPQLDKRLSEFAAQRIEGGVDIVVMGHSHMAGVHKIGNGTYANPGGWQGERTYLVYENGKIEVKKY
ncbi:MAG: UDP-2,3-diacylglucosamine diphosphatase [Thermodesulfobacteriota bacterium]